MTGETNEPKVQTEADRLDLAARVAERVKIHRVMLARCNSDRTLDEDLYEVAIGHGDLWVSIDVVDVNLDVDRQKNRFCVRPIFTLTANKNSPDGAALNVLSIEATFALIYSVESLDEFEDASLIAFAWTNGVFNAWPYWREFVQSTVSRMGLPAITIPVFRV